MTAIINKNIAIQDNLALKHIVNLAYIIFLLSNFVYSSRKATLTHTHMQSYASSFVKVASDVEKYLMCVAGILIQRTSHITHGWV